MQNGREFNLDIQDWAKRFTGSMDALARQTCQQMAEDVVQDTPVDTGFLRGSWQPSLNTPEISGDGENGNPSIKVAAVISGLRAGDKFWMTNNAEYAQYVEFGTSKMAGRFFVTRNMKRFSDIVSKVARELNL